MRPLTPRTRISSGSPFEESIGFSRAIVAGTRVLVSGTGPVFADGSCPADPAAQARRCFQIIGRALAEVGAVHGELLGTVRPAATMVIVAGLLDPRWRVEIEAEADTSS